jgi:hypothetical protein
VVVDDRHVQNVSNISPLGRRQAQTAARGLHGALHPHRRKGRRLPSSPSSRESARKRCRCGRHGVLLNQHEIPLEQPQLLRRVADSVILAELSPLVVLFRPLRQKHGAAVTTPCEDRPRHGQDGKRYKCLKELLNKQGKSSLWQSLGKRVRRFRPAQKGGRLRSHVRRGEDGKPSPARQARRLDPVVRAVG